MDISNSNSSARGPMISHECPKEMEYSGPHDQGERGQEVDGKGTLHYASHHRGDAMAILMKYNE